MLEAQIGSIVAASLAADLVEQIFGPSEIVATVVRAEVFDSERAEAVVVGCAGLVALTLVFGGHWLVVALEVYSSGAAVAVAVAVAVADDDVVVVVFVVVVIVCCFFSCD